MNSFALLQAVPGQGSGMSSIIMLVGMVAVFYFLIFAPQRKQRKKEEEMRSNLKKGDKVTTIGGIRGVVSHINEENGDVTLKVDDNAKITFKKAAVGSVEGEPKAAPEKEKKAKKSDADREQREKELENQNK